jgi:HAD superfamily hydrolase (TIGR01484 family)
LADVDGVVTHGEGKPVDVPILERLAAYNADALRDPLVPAITLCTGRQAPYVELLAQLTGVFLPCIFEHGCGLFYPRAFRYAFHPALSRDYSARLAAVRALLEEPVLAARRAFVQPGKEASMTLYPLADTTVEELVQVTLGAIAPLDDEFGVAWNVNGVEVRPKGVDKGTAFRWLAGELGLPFEAFAGMGDSDTDLAFLNLVGFPAAPANATMVVREQVKLVSTHGYGEGLLDAIERVVQANRSLASQS